MLRKSYRSYVPSAARHLCCRQIILFSGRDRIISVSNRNSRSLASIQFARENADAKGTRLYRTVPLVAISVLALAISSCTIPRATAGQVLTVPQEADNDIAAIASLKPAAWWELSDPSRSALAKDASGPGYDGNVFGQVRFGVPGPYPIGPAGAAFFPGSLSGIRTSFRPSSPQLSVSCWFKASSTKDGALLVTDDTYVTHTGFQFVLGGPGTVNFMIGTGATYGQVSYPVPAGSWVQATATYDGQTLRLYFDGVEADAVRIPGRAIRGRYGAAIGFDPTRQYAAYSGSLAEVAIFNYALSPAQVQAVYSG